MKSIYPKIVVDFFLKRRLVPVRAQIDSLLSKKICFELFDKDLAQEIGLVLDNSIEFKRQLSDLNYDYVLELRDKTVNSSKDWFSCTVDNFSVWHFTKNKCRYVECKGDWQETEFNSDNNWLREEVFIKLNVSSPLWTKDVIDGIYFCQKGTFIAYRADGETKNDEHDRNYFSLIKDQLEKFKLERIGGLRVLGVYYHKVPTPKKGPATRRINKMLRSFSSRASH